MRPGPAERGPPGGTFPAWTTARGAATGGCRRPGAATPPPADAPVPDIGGPGLRVLFCGINPGTLSAATGRHFARPGNRFWRVLFAAGLTDRLLGPSEQDLLPGYGLGITNLVARPTAAASELTTEELRRGAAGLVAKAEAWRPAVVAVLGAGAYRLAFRRPRAPLGRQPDGIGPAQAWVLPNPSGLQARYQLPEMATLYGALRFAPEG